MLKYYYRGMDLVFFHRTYTYPHLYVAQILHFMQHKRHSSTHLSHLNIIRQRF